MNKKRRNTLNASIPQQDEIMYEFEVALNKIRWDIVDLSEVREQGEGLTKRKMGNYFYHFGGTEGHKGVGFYGKIWDKIVEIEKANKRICIAKIKLDGKTCISLIQIYAPSLVFDAEETGKFYSDSQKTTDDERTRLIIMVLGDWNAKDRSRGNDKIT